MKKRFRADERYGHYREVFRGREMPFAFVDLDLLDANVDQVLARGGGKPVRVATKSVRSVAVLRYILQKSGRFRGLMCFTAPEAVWLAGQGFDDLLVAYPTWDSRQVAAVCDAVLEGHHIILMVDSPEHVERVEAVARERGCRLPLCLDVDVSSDFGPVHFGVWRSGVRTPEDAVALARKISSSSYLELDGVMAYEAQIAGVGNEGVGPMGAAIRLLQRRSLPEIAEKRAAVVRALRQAGHQLRFINGGGTGSLHTTSREPVVTELTAGSAFYAPALFDHYRDFRHEPAAGYAVEIVRRPHPGVYTCLGGGYPASGKTGLDKSPQAYLPTGAKLDPNEGAGEVQTPIHYTGPEELRPGDPIFMRHAKAGELCERFESLLLVRDSRVVDEVTTYRGDGKSFL